MNVQNISRCSLFSNFIRNEFSPAVATILHFDKFPNANMILYIRTPCMSALPCISPALTLPLCVNPPNRAYRLIHTYATSISVSARKSTCELGQRKRKLMHKHGSHMLFLVLTVMLIYACVVRVNQPYTYKQLASACGSPQLMYTLYFSWKV